MGFGCERDKFIPGRFAMTGKKDRDSVFAEYARKYGRRERREK